MTHSDFRRVFETYTSLLAMRDEVSPLWNDISKFVGINVDPDYAHRGTRGSRSRQLDDFVDDPTAAISVNQAGDFLAGILWGTGEGVFDIVPSRYVLELVDAEVVQDYYDFTTDQTLYHMNHADAGYGTALRPYMYDQVAFGTSGIGGFLNRGFVERAEDNALIFRNYGVDNVVIDAGKNNLVDYVFATYTWRVSRIVGEMDPDLPRCEVEFLYVIHRNVTAESYRRIESLVLGAYPKIDREKLEPTVEDQQ